MISFDWDEQKNRANQKKHGLWFEEAISVFDDRHGRLFLDSDHSSTEDRYILIGRSSGDNTLVVVHCYRNADSVIRIISARKATKKERNFYEEGI